MVNDPATETLLAIRRRFMNGESKSVIAAALNLPRKTVDNLLAKALRLPK
jgi:hypothetical protein